jgi:hypothetical protein
MRLKSALLYFWWIYPPVMMRLNQREGRLSLGSLTWTHNHPWILLKWMVEIIYFVFLS